MRPTNEICKVTRLAMALTFVAGGAMAGDEWRTLEPGEEQIIFLADGIGRGMFVKTYQSDGSGADAQAEVGIWTTPSVEARVFLMITGNDVFVAREDPVDAIAEVFGKTLAWGPMRQAKNRLGYVDYRIATQRNRACMAFFMTFGFMGSSGQPDSSLMGYYCSKRGLRPERVLECLGVKHIGVPNCPG